MWIFNKYQFGLKATSLWPFFCEMLPVCALVFNESRRNIDYDAALKWSLRCIANNYKVTFNL